MLSAHAFSQVKAAQKALKSYRSTREISASYCSGTCKCMCSHSSSPVLLSGWLQDQSLTCSEFSMTSAMRPAALNFSLLPLDLSGSCSHGCNPFRRLLWFLKAACLIQLSCLGSLDAAASCTSSA